MPEPTRLLPPGRPPTEPSETAIAAAAAAAELVPGGVRVPSSAWRALVRECESRRRYQLQLELAYEDPTDAPAPRDE